MSLNRLSDSFESLSLERTQRETSMQELAHVFGENGGAPEPEINVRKIGPQGHHHEMTFHYPSFDLLPQGAELFLYPPHLIQHREQPRLESFHLHPHALDMAMRFETPAVSCVPSPPQHRPAQHIVELIARLSTCPGISFLKMVTYTHAGHHLFRIQLITLWFTATEVMAGEPQNLYFDEGTYNNLIDNHDHLKWVQHFRQLVERTTDIAFIAVLQRCKSFDLVSAHLEEDRLEASWNMSPIVSANSILAHRMQKLGSYEQDNADIHIVRLPCGHLQHIRAFYILGRLSHEECQRFACSTCGKLVMGGNDPMRIEILEDLQHRRQFATAEAQWDHLKTLTHNREQVQVRAADLKKGLKKALDSCLVPPTVVPHDLSPVYAEETKVACAVLEKYLAHDYETITISPWQTTRTMAKLAIEAIGKHWGVNPAEGLAGIKPTMPVKYIRFLARWFTRAVYYTAMKKKHGDQDVVDQLQTLTVQVDDPRTEPMFMKKHRRGSIMA